MTRRLRVHVPNGFYHVTLRGNHRQPIFFLTTDRDLLDSIMERVVKAAGLQIHAYCWMTNHLHLLAQVSDVPLGRAILMIASQYARKVQQRMDTTGHLFERRYRSVLVDADAYLLTLIRYIHMNPVRAGLVSDPESYEWSSHANYLGRNRPSWVTTRAALGVLGANRDSAVARYREYMGVAVDERWGTGALKPNSQLGDVLGDDEFAARVARGVWQARSTKSLDSLLAECCAKFKVSVDMLASRGKSHQLALARAWLAHESVAGRITSVSGVARRLGRTEGSLRQLMIRYPPGDESGSDGTTNLRPGTK